MIMVKVVILMIKGVMIMIGDDDNYDMMVMMF